MKQIRKIDCGDWHKGWGFGGHNHVGKLEIITKSYCPINFIWRGRSQGRHGQIWNRGAFARFMVTDNGLKLTEQKGSMPDFDQIIEAANTLLRANNLTELQTDNIS